jgi:S1-C subfamily serine protease
MTGRALALLAAIVLLTAGLPAPGSLAQDRHRVERDYRALVRSVVRIETRYASIFAPPGAGSGVVIGDDGLIATADHVIEGAAEIWVVHAGEQRQRAAIVRRAPERDLALLRIEEEGPQFRSCRATVPCGRANACWRSAM